MSSDREVDVKRFILIAPVLALAVFAADARAQVQGQYTGAEVLPAGTHLFGGYLDASSDVVGLMAQLRLSFYPGVDFGFQGGPARISQGGTSRGLLRLGTDLKVTAHHAAPGANYELAMGGALGVETGDNYNLLSLGPSVVVSTRVRSGGAASAGGFAPYAGAMLMFTNVDAGSRSETGFSVPLRLGAEFQASPAARVTAEAVLRIADKFRDHAAFNVGVNLPF
jgi:hypothetical protein